MISRYSCPEIEQIWSEQNKYYLWMRIELSFLTHLKGIRFSVPPAFQQKWIDDIQEREKRTKHDVAAFVEWLEEYLEPITGLSRFVHYGLTSSDILDTAFSMQIMETNRELNTLRHEVMTILDSWVHEYTEVYMVGRTHGQAAEILGLSQKFNCWVESLAYCSPTVIYYGRLSGSVGDHKYFNSSIEAGTLHDLDLDPCPWIDGQIIHRAIYADHMNYWATFASVIAKIATDIRLLAHDGVEEVHEGFAPGQMGSSSMPHKRNPILSENLCGLARVIRGHQVTAMQNIELWNERDISHSSAERIIFPETAILLGFMLNRLKSLLENLYIDKEKMGINVQRNYYDMGSQRRMLEHIDQGLSRKEAHERVKEQGF